VLTSAFRISCLVLKTIYLAASRAGHMMVMSIDSQQKIGRPYISPRIGSIITSVFASITQPMISDETRTQSALRDVQMSWYCLMKKTQPIHIHIGMHG
jgi:hypothetical protein